MPTTYHADGQHEDSLMKPLRPCDYCFSLLFLKFLFSLVFPPLNIPTEVLTQVTLQMQFTNKGAVLCNVTKPDVSFMQAAVTQPPWLISLLLSLIRGAWILCSLVYLLKESKFLTGGKNHTMEVTGKSNLVGS